MEKISAKNLNNTTNLVSISQNETNILKELTDDLVCPTCLVVQKPSLEEDKLLTCSSCKNKFTYLKCYHCKKKIYFKNQAYIDGVNIKCPYPECGKYFSKSSCGSCEKALFFPDRYQEGSKVKCPFIRDCGDEYSKIICPIENCCTKISFKIQSNNQEIRSSTSIQTYKEGALVQCKSTTCNAKFQKINCYFCLKRLVWISPKIMIEGQKIQCPYEDCMKTFNKIYCPHCQKCNVFTRGGMEIGSKIQCIYKECGKVFNKVFCPHCNRMNVFANGGFQEGVKTQCVYSNCMKTFSLTNCSHCKRANIWAGKEYIPGQNIICAYSDCRKKSAKVNCPSCNKLNVFPNGDYSFGKKYNCVYQNCSAEFTNFVCPGCYTCLNLKGKYLEGNKVICGMNNCKNSFLNFRCPHCMQTIMDKGSSYKFGQSVICPYTKCAKKFNYLYCLACRRGIYFKDNTYQEGQIIICPYNDCLKNFIFIYCTHCQKPVQFSNNITKSISLEDEIKCVYPNCEKKFSISNINKKIWNVGIPFFPHQGTFFNYFDPMQEIQEMKVLASIILINNVYKSLGHQIKQIEEDQVQKKENVEVEPISECILCMCNPKESVFIPCGHRCVCYDCGMSTYTKYGKCPVCQTISTSLLKKVYD